MVSDQALIVAGIGCRRGCAADAIMELIATALSRIGAGTEALGALAAPSFKRSEPGIVRAGHVLGCDIVWISRAALAAPQALCRTHSRSVSRAVGVGSVAEASALAAAGAGGRLLLTRIDNGVATCALAKGAAVKGGCE